MAEGKFLAAAITTLQDQSRHLTKMPRVISTRLTYFSTKATNRPSTEIAEMTKKIGGHEVLLLKLP